MTSETHAVTGAFGYSGKYIARRLLDSGKNTITLTNSSHRQDPFEGKVKAFPLQFHKPQDLERSLEGVSVLYNTYWVRFNHRTFTHAEAVANTKTLFEAAKKAGVKRIVHVSITNPSIDSPLEYFRGKAELEATLANSGISHAILRPTVLFGREDILVNNMAWVLRRSPVFGVFGHGRYKLQPIYVDDLAELAVTHGAGSENIIVDAIGPETFEYRDLIQAIGRIIGKERWVVSVPPWFGYYSSALIGKMLGDVVITREEIRGLMDGLLHVESPAAGRTKLTDWARENKTQLGIRYANELSRRVNHTK
ncbi:MAG: NAD(P)H-binding protein [Gemmatimonadota bacterium]|nr:NAD(P)H-binding protein [Gemmatimonadota bacterium]